MTTIHSSSLSFQPTGYVRPDRTAFESASSVTREVAPAHDNTEQRSRSASTPQQIQAAIEQNGLSNENKLPQVSDPRTAKALASYSQTNNQSAQDQLSSLFSGIDLYA